MRRTSSPTAYSRLFARLGARRGHEAEVVALEQAVEAPVHLELEEPERRFRPAGPGRRHEGQPNVHLVRLMLARSCGALVGIGDGFVHHGNRARQVAAPGMRAWLGAMRGISIAVMMRLTIVSASTPSASAS